MRGIKEFLKVESSAAIFLFAATCVALFFANTQLHDIYSYFIDINIAIQIGNFEIKKPMLLWVNDGLMTIFFFMIGLELKREFVHGHLADPKQVILPASGALGGIIMPALVFYLFNISDHGSLRGWAIPTATDIAFALGVLALCSHQIPKSAKIFLLTLAIFDDLAAIIIIALFYTAHISVTALTYAFIGILGLLVLNRSKIISNIPYVLTGVFLWACVLKSGVHATLAGVITALFMPAGKNTLRLEHDLHPWVAFFILPLFAFSNTGLNLLDVSLNSFINSVTLGCTLGLFLGKQVGVFIFSYICLKITKIKNSDFKLITLWGLSLLSGIGFTMSLFIASLAYGRTNLDAVLQARMGVLLGSLLSGVSGYLVLRYLTIRRSKHILRHVP